MRRTLPAAAVFLALVLGLPSTSHGQAGGTVEAPPPMGEGVILTEPFTDAIFQQVKAGLESRGLYSGWVDELAKDPPTIRFKEDIGDNQALYQPFSQGPLGREGNTVYLKPGPNPLHLEQNELATITHELWHAWFDFVPTFPFTPVSRFSDAQDEAIGGFLDELVEGNGLADAVGRAITEATGENRGGTSKDAIDAILALNEEWRGTLLGPGLTGDGDVRDWEVMRRGEPEMKRLEDALPEEDREKIAAREAELERMRAEEDEIELDPVPQPSGGPPDAAEDRVSDAETSRAPRGAGSGATIDEMLNQMPAANRSIADFASLVPAAVADAPVDRATQYMLLEPALSIEVRVRPGALPGEESRGGVRRLYLTSDLPTVGHGAAHSGAHQEFPRPERSRTSTGPRPPTELYIRSLGLSTGEAFEVVADDDLTRLAEWIGAGLVVEPVQLNPAARAEVDRALGSVAATGSTVAAYGYCLEFLRTPPASGQMFRVAPPQLQQEFDAVKRILVAGNQLAESGMLNPDSDPTGYMHSIKQWALWASEEGFDLGSFGDAFLEHTRKNFEAAGREWSGEVEDAVRDVVPNRWNDIEQVLTRAGMR